MFSLKVTTLPTAVANHLDDPLSQYVATFPSRSLADVYWRALQEAPETLGSPYRRYHSRYIMGEPSLPPSIFFREELSEKFFVQKTSDTNVISFMFDGEQRPDNVNGGAWVAFSVPAQADNFQLIFSDSTSVHPSARICSCIITLSQSKLKHHLRIRPGSSSGA
jgi:hypothetical protein